MLEKNMLVGVDEAGVGALMGNLVAAAVAFPNDDGTTMESLPILKDSKKMTPKRRTEAADRLRETVLFGMGIVSNAEIDELGMARCRRLVFTRALDALAEAHPEATFRKIIVDGTLFDGWRGVDYECMPRADATVPQVSAASILAKTCRDAQVNALCEAEPEVARRYAWTSNKGYPSEAHIRAVLEDGRTPHHRRTFQLKQERATGSHHVFA